VRELTKEGLIVDVFLPAPESLDRYFLVTDLRDYSLIKAAADFPQYIEEWIRNGDIPPPVGPHWPNLLREPGLFTEQAKDFMALNDKYQGRYDQ
jgi:hypothetical protein